MKTIRNKIEQEREKSVKLRGLDLSHVPFEDAIKIRKKQEEAWNKFNFLKKLNKAMEEKNEKSNR